MGLVDFDKFKSLSVSKQDDHRLHRGYSKSGLDWDSDAELEIKVNESESNESEIVESYTTEERDRLDGSALKAYIMSIHKKAAELYNLLDEGDAPEEWVMAQAKEANDMLNSIHGHVSYAKHKSEELATKMKDKLQEKGW